MAFNEIARVGHVNQATLSSDGTAVLSTSSAQILAANSDRKMLFITNHSASVKVRVRFGSAASATAGVVLNPEESLILDRVVPTESVNAIAASGTPSLYYAEFE